MTKRKVVAKRKTKEWKAIPDDKAEVERLIGELLKTLENFTPMDWCDEWDTPSQFWSWMRGRLRSIWSKDWVPKNDYLSDSKIDVPKLDSEGNQIYYKTGKRVGKPVTFKAYKCEITGEIIPASKPKGAKTALYNIDHIEDAGSCRNGLEVCVYLFRVLTSPENMQLITAESHKILTHMKKKDMTWEEAVIDKKAIAWENDKHVDHKEVLINKGFTEDEVSNKPKRHECYIKLLNG